MVDIGNARSLVSERLNKRQYQLAFEAAKVVIELDGCFPQTGHSGLPYWQAGFALDAMGKENSFGGPDSWYKEAIRLEPFNAAFHASLICYYVDREKYLLAIKSWEAAVELTKDPDDEMRAEAYIDLYFPVALHLLLQLKTTLVKEVLGAIPPEVIRRHSGLLAIFNAYRVLMFNQELTNMGVHAIDDSNTLGALPEPVLNPMRYAQG